MPGKESLMLRNTIIVFSVFIGAAALAGAQAKLPVMDGTVGAAEYAHTYDVSPFILSMSRNGGNLYCAVSAKTNGWVAIGLGTDRMNGAVMFLGNVIGGKAGFTEQLGRGHGHGDVAADKRTVVTYAVKEQGDTTTMEVECRAAALAPAGSRELTVILAYSVSDSMTDRHAVHRTVTIQLD
jgi:hypothetical protein